MKAMRIILSLLLAVQAIAIILAIALYRGGTLAQFSITIVVLFCASVLGGILTSILELLNE